MWRLIDSTARNLSLDTALTGAFHNLGVLLTLSRPRLLPYLLALPLCGFGWAHWDRALPLTGGDRLLWVLASWTVLSAGTLWLNAALDRDEGEVLMGRAVPVPDNATTAGWCALTAAVLLASLAGPVPGTAAFACAVMAVLYSHPAVVAKGHPIWGPAINWVGYGLLSPLAGWAVVGVDMNPRTVACWLLSSLGVLGTYFAAQAFQGEEDARRGYRTLVVTHGPRAAIGAARVAIAAGLLGAMVLAAIGWLPRICLAGTPLWWWIDRQFVAWARICGDGNERWARRIAQRLMLTGWVALSLTFAEYVRESFAGEPVAGLGTVAGHPSDRPVLPAAILKARDARRANGRDAQGTGPW